MHAPCWQDVERRRELRAGVRDARDSTTTARQQTELPGIHLQGDLADARTVDHTHAELADIDDESHA